jgi:hypothetical protein
MTVKLIAITDKDMANGMRNNSKTPLTESEIEYVKSEIQRIEADSDVFIFNDERHIKTGTCYNYLEDKIHVVKNVLPDEKYGSTHPRDLMSVGAVLAHEYYGHRMYRDEYLSDYTKGKDFRTTPMWQDECRASINAAKIAPNLTDRDKTNLIMDAIYRAKEYGQLIEMDDFMKEVIYGYRKEERNISYSITPIHYVSESSLYGTDGNREGQCGLSQMPETSDYFDDVER